MNLLHLKKNFVFSCILINILDGIVGKWATINERLFENDSTKFEND